MFWLLFMIAMVSSLQGDLAGGRPNSISGGLNAFAGVTNPANAVWIKDRFDVGAFWVYQDSFLNNRDNNPLFTPGKSNTAYHKNNLYSFDAAIKRQLYFTGGEGAITLAAYSTPNKVEVKTKEPVPISGTTPIARSNRTQVFSVIFSLKVGEIHSVGISADYYWLSHQRRGNQNADNPARSVSPGNVTNNGMDHSGGFGMSVGWRTRVTPKLDFGATFIKKSYVGQFRKYRGFEPQYARNYIPLTVGAGLGFRFTDKLAGRIESIWSHYGNTPGANRTVYTNGKLNPNKRGSNKSPGPGLQDVTFINLGLGYRFTPSFSLGLGYSHRLRPGRTNPDILTHPYRFQTIYDMLTLGSSYTTEKQEFFLAVSRGFRNKVSGRMPEPLGGGRFVAERETVSVSFSWGYFY